MGIFKNSSSMTSIYKCVTLALAQTALASVQEHMNMNMQADYTTSDSNNSESTYDYNDESYTPSAGEKIKGALEAATDAFVERYVDEQAIEQWVVDSENIFSEMSVRHEQEREKLLTDAITDVKGALIAGQPVKQWAEGQVNSFNETTDRQDEEAKSFFNDLKMDLEAEV